MLVNSMLFAFLLFQGPGEEAIVSPQALIDVCRAEEVDRNGSFHTAWRGTVFCLHGMIDEEDLTRAMSDLANARHIVLRSEGGMGRIYIQLALSAQNVESVVVDSYCLSSCANFLFFVGRTKHVPENSYIAFHGGPTLNVQFLEEAAKNGVRIEHPDWTDDEITRSETYLRRLQLSMQKSQALIDGQSVLYARHGVSRDFSTVLNSVSFDYTEGESPGWSPSREVLSQCFGVDGIATYWKPSDEYLTRIARQNFPNIRLFSEPAGWQSPCGWQLSAPDQHNP